MFCKEYIPPSVKPFVNEIWYFIPSKANAIVMTFPCMQSNQVGSNNNKVDTPKNVYNNFYGEVEDQQAAPL